MNEIGCEYGKALFLLAEEENALFEFEKALLTLKEIFEKNPLYEEFLSSPHIPAKERFLALDEALKDALPENVLNFLKLLCEKGRISCFEKAVEEFRRLLSVKERIRGAKIKSAAPLTEEEKEKLLKKLEEITGCKIQGEFVIAPEILGGVTVETDGKILDGSIKGRLKEAKEVITR